VSITGPTGAASMVTGPTGPSGGGSFSWATAPTGSNATGVAGSIAYDASYFYIATAANTWKRALLSSPFGFTGTFTAIPIMTAASAPSGTASASAILQAGLDAFKAFNKATVSADDNFYASPNPAADSWVQYDFGADIYSRIGGYTITSRNNATHGVSSDGASQAPVAWTLAGSNDGTTFTTIDTRTSQSFTQAETRTFTLSSPAEYRVFRWTWTTSPGGGAVVLPKIQLVAP
jgi:hypothetical protein